ncbi:MAG: glycosyl hydrolase [Planctomycetota bacterium]
MIHGATRPLPSRARFLLKMGAYLLFLCCLWYLLQQLFRLGTELWDRIVERPGTSIKPYLEGEGCYLGIYRPEAPLDTGTIRGTEQALDRRFSVISIYQAWGSGEEHRFPARELTLISNAGYVPMLTWEPWTSEFDQDRFGRRSERSYRSLRDVAEGCYDSYLRSWARDCMAWGRPLLLRFAHEMNNPRYPWSFATGNTPEDFTSAWRHVWQVFDQQGCRNVAWVWSPLSAASMDTYYPGEQWVDWVGVAVLNYGVTWPPYRWWSFEDLLEVSYQRLAGWRKPILVSEAGTVGESADKGDWLTATLRSLRPRFPLVRLVVFFDAPNDTSHFPEGVPWAFSNHPSILARMKGELTSPWFRSIVPLDN